MCLIPIPDRGVIHEFQESHHVVEVVQRLADAHEHDIRDLCSRVQLGKQHLIYELRRLKAPDQTAIVDAQKAHPMRQPT